MSTHNHPILKKCTCEDCRAERGEITSVGDYATDLMLTALHTPLADIKDFCNYVEIDLEPFNADDEEVVKWRDAIKRVRAWLNKVNPPTGRN